MENSPIYQIIIWHNCEKEDVCSSRIVSYKNPPNRIKKKDWNIRMKLLKKEGRRLIPQMFVCFVLWMVCSIKVDAAYPADLNEKNMKAYAWTESVSVYEDGTLQNLKCEVSGDGFVLLASDVTDDQKSLYGSYSNAQGEKGEGWIPSSVFRVDENFNDIYYTVRSDLTIYTSSAIAKKRASIKKYSGIIVIGKKNGAYQVIYENKDGYGIGWMDGDSYEPKLNYDGRDKQILADGDYTFTSFGQIQKAAVEAEADTEQAESGPEVSSESMQTQEIPSHLYRLEYISHKMYRIFDVEKNQYLKVNTMNLADMEETAEVENPDWMEDGWRHTLKMLFDTSYRQQVEEWETAQEEKQKQLEDNLAKIESGELYNDTENDLVYELSTTDQVEEASRFLLSRQEDYFYISYDKTNIYLGDGEKGVILSDMETMGESHLWKVRAAGSMIDTSSPMVFTQYDAEWCGKAYGSEGCMGTAGCGILSTVNAVYALTGQYMSVMDLADYAVETGLRIVGSGTDEGIFKAAAQKYGSRYGFAYDGSAGSIKKLKEKLKQGDVATVHVIGHYVSIVAYDEGKNKFLLLDSNWLPKRETTAFGDWISPSRLQDGALYGQKYFFFKQAN